MQPDVTRIFDLFQNYVIIIATAFHHFQWGHNSNNCVVTIHSMASNLMEADIPGASLGNRDPQTLKVVELKFWLRSRGATGLSKLKTKADCLRQ